MLSTVARAFEVLSLFTPTESSWGASSVALRLGLPKSSAHDLLRSLYDLGMLERQTGGQYRLGLGLLTLTHSVCAGRPWLAASRQAIAALAEASGEVVHLSVLQDGALLHLEDAHPNCGYGEDLGLPSPGLASMSVPPQCSAMGKAMLSALPWSEVQALIRRQGLPGLTVNSISTPDELQTELERIRQQGYAYDVEEAFPGVCCIAVPVHGEDGRVQAAISMSMKADRFYAGKAVHRAQLLEAVARLEAAIRRTPVPRIQATA
ncbi:IclR family transcriptional regulator [Deinococcus aquiradiocola]|uniref:IclR family transcriptional regulator n=1 Tax=Deinococcus aquiradiocola TaxID=393059 RepID=A0A917UMW2_9DEIO|nr:IclR family transcriptional regulator [Deinococcus aquiradiocola]GGJ69547.1 IclR family transcriptional regulator [Deinococcus aquiradiocola]